MQQDTLYDLLNQAWTSIQRNQPNQALRTNIKTVLNNKTASPEQKVSGHYYLGVLYYLERQYQQAINYFSKALMMPNNNRSLANEIAQKYTLLLEQCNLIELALDGLNTFVNAFPEETWFKQKKEALENRIADQNYPAISNVENWKKLQKGGYFDHHIHYQKSEGLRWDGNDLNIISKYMTIQPDMTVAIIGAGYGRESAIISPLVKQIYGIDVSQEILDRAVQELKKKKVLNFIPVLHEDWKEKVPNTIDLVYCFTVFQHLTKYLVMDYLTHFSSKLSVGGHFICQFMSSAKTGSFDAVCVDYEPHVSWTQQEIEASFGKVGLK